MYFMGEASYCGRLMTADDDHVLTYFFNITKHPIINSTTIGIPNDQQILSQQIPNNTNKKPHESQITTSGVFKLHSALHESKDA